MAEAVPESILKTIRKMVGPAEDYTYFDTDLIININSAFSRLCQLGVGPSEPFKITGEEERSQAICLYENKTNFRSSSQWQCCKYV